MQSLSTPTSPEDLCFQRFCRMGDRDALARVFDLTAPRLLRSAIRWSRCAADAEDLLQATFVVAIERAKAFDTQRPALPWLLGILVNQAKLRQWSEGRTPRAERLPPRTPVEPSETLQASELHEALAGSLGLVPEPYGQVLTMRLRDGLTAEAIARALGRPPGTVRSQITRGLALMREHLPAGLAGLVALLAMPEACLAAVRAAILPKVAGVAAGASIAASVVAIALVSGLMLLATAGPGAAALPEPVADPAALAVREVERAAAAAPVRMPLLERMPIVKAAGAEDPAQDPGNAAQDPATATLEVTLRWSDGEPAAGQPVETQELDAPSNTLSQRVTLTDAAGVAMVRGLAPGMVHVRTAFRRTFLDTMQAARVYRVSFTLDGVHVEGQVQDALGRPILGARVLLWSRLANEEGGLVATSDADGKFALRGVPDFYRVGVRAAGYAPTAPQIVRAGKASVPLIFALQPGGATIRGRVVDRAGQAIADAHVFVGAERLRAADDVCGESFNADHEGQFEASSVPVGEVEVQARALGYGPARQRCVTEEHGLAVVTVELAPEVRVVGRVTGPDQKPVSGANVVVGSFASFAGASTRSKTDGSFELRSVAAGDIEILANDNAQASAKATLAATPGTTLTWNPQLGLGEALQIRVVDASGKALAGWYVYAMAREPHWSTGGYTDADGRVVFGHRPLDAMLSISTCPKRSAASVVVLRDLQPAPGEQVLIQVQDASRPSGYIRARFIDEQGQPFADASLWLSYAGMISPGIHEANPKTGAVEVGPLPPREYEIDVVRGYRIVKRLGRSLVVADGVVDLGEIIVR